MIHIYNCNLTDNLLIDTSKGKKAAIYLTAFHLLILITIFINHFAG